MTVPSTASLVTAAFTRARRVVEEHAEELGRLDAVAGDGDHGLGMVRGLRAAEVAASCESVGRSISAAADAFADAAGGASGALWGVFLRAVGMTLGDDEAAGSAPRRVVAALRAGQARIEEVGKCRLGDKTMLDALVPFIDTFESVAGSEPLGLAWRRAVEACEEATAATAGLVARRGRSAVLGERSVGTVDPGARSMCLVLGAMSVLFEEGS